MRRKLGGTVIVLAILAIGRIVVWGDEPAKPAPPVEKKAEIAASDRVPLAVAKDRAKILQEAYLATLEVVHDHYFHGDRSIVPARAMEDIFFQMSRQTKTKARWISVNTKAMSLHHEPRDSFEKHAAQEIADGKEAVDAVEDGVYRRAVAIHLAEGCVNCHSLNGLAAQSKTPRYAGLVINIPVTTDEAPSDK